MPITANHVFQFAETLSSRARVRRTGISAPGTRIDAQ